jgi:hypothetical protein
MGILSSKEPLESVEWGKGEGDSMRRTTRFVVLAALLALMLALSAGAALAGEVKGPPDADPKEETAAPAHANSICAYSGLNDGHPPLGQVQSYGQDVKEGRADPHVFNPGDVCHGGSNPRNP